MIHCPICDQKFLDGGFMTHSRTHVFELEQRRTDPNDPAVNRLLELGYGVKRSGDVFKIPAKDTMVENLDALRQANQKLIDKLAELSTDYFEAWRLLERKEVTEVMSAIFLAMAKSND